MVSVQAPSPAVAAQPGRRHVPALDGLRGIAVLLVFFLHYGGGAQAKNPLLHIVGVAQKGGGTGVTLFFLLSGFLITGILWDSRGDPHWWRNFYVRRALRILPLYYGALILILLVAACNGTLGQAARVIWVQALYLQTFPHFFTQPWQVPPPLNVHHFWTLAIEEQFYLLWPLALRVMPSRRAATWMCLGVFAASFAYRAGSHAVLAPLTGNFLLLTHSGEFALGGWLAFVHRGAAWQRTRRWLMPVACLCGVLFIALTARHDFVMVTPMNFAVGLATISVAFAGLIAAALQPGVVQRLAGLGWLRWVGKISFGIYVYHLLLRALFEWIATRLTHTADGNKFLLVRLLVALVGTLVIAALSYSFYERPFLRFKRHFQAAGHPRSEATVRPVA